MWLFCEKHCTQDPDLPGFENLCPLGIRLKCTSITHIHTEEKITSAEELKVHIALSSSSKLEALVDGNPATISLPREMDKFGTEVITTFEDGEIVTQVTEENNEHIFIVSFNPRVPHCYSCHMVGHSVASCPSIPEGSRQPLLTELQTMLTDAQEKDEALWLDDLFPEKLTSDMPGLQQFNPQLFGESSTSPGDFQSSPMDVDYVDLAECPPEPPASAPSPTECNNDDNNNIKQTCESRQENLQPETGEDQLDIPLPTSAAPATAGVSCEKGKTSVQRVCTHCFSPTHTQRTCQRYRRLRKKQAKEKRLTTQVCDKKKDD